MLEHMDEFFANRVVGYDEHMLNDVMGCNNGYLRTAELLAKLKPSRILDLGCGTGLELDAIFKLLPDVAVTGIDMTEAMLAELKRKHPDKQLELILGDYFTVPFDDNYDAAVSVESLHHFTRAEKLGLYKKLNAALKPGGIYIEVDYMCDTLEQEEHFLAEREKLVREQNITGFVHYDTPITVDGQISLLTSAGFSSVEQLFREENTVMLYCVK